MSSTYRRDFTPPTSPMAAAQGQVIRAMASTARGHPAGIPLEGCQPIPSAPATRILLGLRYIARSGPLTLAGIPAANNTLSRSPRRTPS